MAVKAGTGKWIADGVHQVTWATLANGDTGTPASDVYLPNHEVSISGTFGTGGSVTIEGSNDGTNFFTLKDWQGSAVTFTAAGIKTVVDNPQQIRPNVTAGDGTTALVAIMTSSGE
jgi:hypothetical protein